MQRLSSHIPLRWLGIHRSDRSFPETLQNSLVLFSSVLTLPYTLLPYTSYSFLIFFFFLKKYKEEKCPWIALGLKVKIALEKGHFCRIKNRGHMQSLRQGAGSNMEIPWWTPGRPPGFRKASYFETMELPLQTPLASQVSVGMKRRIRCAEPVPGTPVASATTQGSVLPFSEDE